MDTLEVSTIEALSTMSKSAVKTNIQRILPQFATPLKKNFENKTLWLRYGLALSLSQESAHSALQAFHECLRIDQNDPLPAMLAAKLAVIDLDEPEEAIRLAKIAINRSLDIHADEGPYKNPNRIISRCYLLASIIHAHIYENQPESMRNNNDHSSSLAYLGSAKRYNPEDYLLYFHQALHEARDRSYNEAVHSLRQALKFNPHHVPSTRLLLLSLSAAKNYDETIVLCESALNKFRDDLTLLYIKCNLERRQGEAKSALVTVQHILRIIRVTSPKRDDSTRKLFGDEKDPKEVAFASELSIWLLAAEIYIDLGRYHDAQQCVDEGSSCTQGALSDQVMFVRGLIAKAKNNLPEAKSFLQTCLALSPKHARALQQLGHVHSLLGCHVIAEKFLRDSLDLDSDDYLTWQYLSLVHIELNQHEQASECIKKSSRLKESSPVVSLKVIPRLTLE